MEPTSQQIQVMNESIYRALNGEVRPERIVSGEISAYLIFTDGFIEAKSKDQGRVKIGTLKARVDTSFSVDRSGIVLYSENDSVGWTLIPSTTGNAAIMTFYNSAGVQIMAVSPAGLSAQTQIVFNAASIASGTIILRADAAGFLDFEIESDPYFRCSSSTGTNRSYKDLTPDQDNLTNLGSATRGWKEVFAYTYTTIPSSIEKKENIVCCEHGLVDIMKLEPIQYTLKEQSFIDTGERVHDLPNKQHEVRKESRTILGLSAQDLDKVMPNLVRKHGEELGINYIEMIPVLINAIKELNAKVEVLEGKNK